MHRKIIDYIPVYSNSLEGLKGRVKHKIKQGYQPVGGLVYDNIVYSMCMVKYEEIKPSVTTKVEVKEEILKHIPAKYYSIEELENIISEMRRVENES